MTIDDLEPVAFISVEHEAHLLVSFYVVHPDDPADGRSLILLRNRRWEDLLPEGERGVKVSDEGQPDGDRDDNFLERIQLSSSAAEIKSTWHYHKLDLTRVERSELQQAKAVLKRMNYDKRFTLEFT